MLARRWNGFPYHYGSYATRQTEVDGKTDAFPYPRRTSSAPGSVSIPLWFLRNPEVEVHTEMGALFPYHYGSYATVNTRIHIVYVYSFHTTMVLTQPIYKQHIGPSGITVSIPLWFLRNRFYYKDIIQVLGRQNQPNKKIP